MAGLALLPDQHKDFSSKTYWATFFQQRSEGFEWYGDYRDLQDLARQELGVSAAEILVVGCGNSSFSADLYDDGYTHVCNIDFEESVIASMLRLHVRARPAMRWLVMDMTQMTPLCSNTFDAVIDKGGMDALMSEPGEKSAREGAKMIQEVLRVLQCGGRYMCVTLAQDFILDTLLSHLSGCKLELHALEAARPSPYLPFVLVATKPTTSTTINTDISTTSTTTNTDIPSTSSTDTDEQVRVTFHFDAEGLPGVPVEVCGSVLIYRRVAQAQSAHRRRFELGTLRPGRFDEENLWAPGNEVTPRFTLTIIDVEDSTIGTPSSPLPCAVLLIPRGRETDFTFSTRDGLEAVARTAGASRLVAVRLNRGHEFSTQEDVRAELTPSLPRFAPRECRVPGASSIPIMAVQEDLGDLGDILAEGDLPGGGGYVVEEVPDDDMETASLRRLIFTSNQSVVQTEVRLIPPGGGGKGPKKKGSKGGSNKKKGRNSNSKMDKGGVENSNGNLHSERVFDFSYLCFEYHRCMIAGGALAGLHTQKEQGERATVLVIGLGGGALPMALRRYFPSVRITVCELDRGVNDIATQYFGLEESEHLHVIIHDGIEYVNNIADTGVYDAIYVDVDSKDTSVGMSCPPAAFVSPEYLNTLKRVLKPRGLLCVNLAARSKAMRTTVLGGALSVFCGTQGGGGEVLELREGESDLNTVIFALKKKRSPTLPPLHALVKTALSNTNVGNTAINFIVKAAENLSVVKI